jgi:hypothetical protein
MFDFTDFFRSQSNYPVGQNRAAQYQWQRQQASQEGVSSSLSIIGGIFGKMAEANRARDYADAVNEAKLQAYANARKVADAQKESNLKLADFQATLKEQNAAYLTNNAFMMKDAAILENELGVSNMARVGGDIKAQFATSGVTIGTGSTKDIISSLVGQVDLDRKNKYSARLNEINSTLAQVASEKLDAAFIKWNAKEQNRFIDANVGMTVY